MLLTRSPLEYPPKEAFPLDLHVLSTPPAFVLSQDQTLHRKPKTFPTKRTRLQTRSTSKQSQNHCSSINSKKNPTTPTNRADGGSTYKPNLSTNTLLSSQKSDAHRHRPSRTGAGATLENLPVRPDPVNLGARLPAGARPTHPDRLVPNSAGRCRDARQR